VRTLWVIDERRPGTAERRVEVSPFAARILSGVRTEGYPIQTSVNSLGLGRTQAL